MPYDDDKPNEGPARQDEGVRLIGADEAAEAEHRDDVAHRRSRDEPRFGDRPPAPDAAGPRPAIRFPLPADETPSPRVRARDDDTALPHWTEPATGEVPRIFAAEDLEDADAGWASFSSGQPRWRGEGDRHDEIHDFSALGDDETRVGALAGDDRDPDDFFSFEDDDDWDREPARVGAADLDDEYEEDEPPAAPGRTRAISSDPRRSSTRAAATASPFDRPAGAGRDMPMAIGVGVAFAALALIALAVGPQLTLALIAVVLTGAAIELFSVLRQAGYQPATLLGLSAVVALPLAAYWRGEAGIPVVLFLTVAFGLVWYLAGAGGDDRPVIGLSSTLFGVAWVGVLGSTAALMLTLGTTSATEEAVREPGLGILLVAIVGAVFYDIGGFAVGRNAGSRPLSAASPNKTVEGLAGGVVISIVAVLVVGFFLAPLSEVGFASKLLVAVGIAVAAPLGDLCQSLVKRDLGVKDMGTILPGHGGLLDRFDALLFVLPVTYYLSRIVFF